MGRRAWTAPERRWLLSIWDTILPGGAVEALPLTVWEAGLEAYHADLVRHAPLDIGLGLRATTWLIMVMPWVVLGRPAWFAALERSDREQVIERLARSRWFLLRELPELHKLMATMGYCAQPSVQRAVGVPYADADAPSWAQEGA